MRYRHRQTSIIKAWHAKPGDPTHTSRTVYLVVYRDLLHPDGDSLMWRYSCHDTITDAAQWIDARIDGDDAEVEDGKLVIGYAPFLKCTNRHA